MLIMLQSIFFYINLIVIYFHMLFITCAQNGHHIFKWVAKLLLTFISFLDPTNNSQDFHFLYSKRTMTKIIAIKSTKRVTIKANRLISKSYKKYTLK